MKNLSIYTFCFFSLVTCSTRASVVINETRVIFSSGQESRTVQIVNKSETEHLVQAWIDDGDQQKSPEDIRTALTVYPPVVKINPGSGQALKLIKNSDAAALPQDRESAFWLNILDIPPMPEGKQDNYVQVAIRSRIKVLWRPKGLHMPVSQIEKNIHVRNNNNEFCLSNDTPYYLTVISFESAGLATSRVGKGNVLKTSLFIPPFTCPVVPQTGSDKSVPSLKYRVGIMDDYGTKQFFTID